MCLLSLANGDLTFYCFLTFLVVEKQCRGVGSRRKVLGVEVAFVGPHSAFWVLCGEGLRHSFS